jgi:DNA-binding CsgD family transcriptional regulator
MPGQGWLTSGALPRPLRGREPELAHLNRLVADIRSGGSRALIIRGDQGIGKSALLDYLADEAGDCQVIRALGIESESELAFGGLHQVCAPLLGDLERLSGPQREALATVFGLSVGSAPDQLLVGLATLSMLSLAAQAKPVLCLVDDQQWVDLESRKVLAFVARRGASSLGFVLVAQDEAEGLAGIEELPLCGLTRSEARALLDPAFTGSLDQQVRDQMVTETRGNPRAILELTARHNAVELAGGFAVPHWTPAGVSGKELERRHASLPEDARRLLLVASGDPTGDAALVWRAARALGIGTRAAGPAVDAGLVEFGGRISFCHPSARSLSYWSAPVEQRQRAHRALANETGSTVHPDRYVWHLAEASPGPDEDVADELERCAPRAGVRGGPAAAAAFLQRSVVLTTDPHKRVRRAVAAATVQLQAGGLEDAAELLDVAESGPLRELDRARITLLRAQAAAVLDRGGEASVLLRHAAAGFETLDPEIARETYLDAFRACLFAGNAASSGGTFQEVARDAATALRATRPTTASDFLLRGLTVSVEGDYAQALPHFRSGLAASSSETTSASGLRSLWLKSLVAAHVWEDQQWLWLSDRYLELARGSGALAELPLALSARAMALSYVGDLDTAESVVEEQQVVTELSGSRLPPYGGMCLAAMRGQAGAAERLVELASRRGLATGEGFSIAVAKWTRAVLCNGQGRYAQATAAARQALEHQGYPGVRCPGIATWAAIELIEAASRSDDHGEAQDAVDWLSSMTSASQTPWALGVQARSRALVSSGADADAAFLQAIAQLRRTQVRSELARTHLLYGEWLRRERRRTEARHHLRTAHQALDDLGMQSFAERAHRELLATGETARRRSSPDAQDLTAQEVQVAQLAREGLTNPEIASRLSLSTRTVQYHLSKVFAKLGITSRSQLDRVQLTR